MSIETLICRQGNHVWQREALRGRKPVFCPEHRQEIAEAANTARTEYASKTMAQKKLDLDHPVLVQILDDHYPLTELKRKLLYVIGEFERPLHARDESGWKFLQSIFKELLREAERSIQPCFIII